MEHSTPITFPEDETFDIGQDTRTGVALLEYRYDVPFKFTGTINKLTFNLGPEQLTAEEREQLHEALAQARDER
jgi:arylsulfatase